MNRLASCQKNMSDYANNYAEGFGDYDGLLLLKGSVAS